MRLWKSKKFWRLSLFGLVGVALAVLLWQVHGVLTPFWLALFIAYLFHPVVDKLHRLGVSKGLSIGLVFLGLVAVVTCIIMFGIPEMFKEFNKLAQNLPQYAGQLQESFSGMHRWYQRAGFPAGVVKAIDANLAGLEEWVGEKLKGVIAAIITFISVLPLLILAPILAIYLLYDWERIKTGLKEMVPYCWRNGAIHLGQETSRVLRRFLRGHLTVATLVGIMTGLGMKLIGMDYALLIGVISALFDVIPYFGPVIGAVPVMALALLKSPQMALWAAGVILIVQQLESNIIQPKVVGNSVGLHPLVVVFVLLAGGDLFGFWGMILAVPVAAVIRVWLAYIYLKLV
ncbi:MAG TPA: AI-2E family transporter [Desulfobacteria bacterium]|nr:AI-2E family transporter [Desulfobacteria bacterium]